MRQVVIAVMVTTLAGCAMGHRDPVEIKQALNEAINEANSRQLQQLPASVEADLMPELVDRSREQPLHIARFRVQANQVDAAAFFTSLVKGSDYSVAIHPAVSGQITLNLSNVTLDEVLAVVRDLYGFEVEKVGRVLQVYPAGLRTVTIPVDYLQFQRSGRSITSISTGTVTNPTSSNNSSNNTGSSNNNASRGGTEIETISESNFWQQLESTIGRLIGSGSGQSVMVTPQASVITVRAYPDEIREVRQFLDMSHLRIQRQVILEAKILEVTLNDGFQQGINWSKTFSSNGTNYQLGQGGIPAPTPRLPGMD
ncbi:MAG: secretin N-terminal domain-containing protein, partial [Vibrio metschnikovii]